MNPQESSAMCGKLVTRSDGSYVLLIDPPVNGKSISRNMSTSQFKVTDGGKMALAYTGSVPCVNQKTAAAKTELGSNSGLHKANRLHSPLPVTVFSPSNAVTGSVSKMSSVSSSVHFATLSKLKLDTKICRSVFDAKDSSEMSVSKITSLKPAVSVSSSEHPKHAVGISRYVSTAKVSTVMTAANVSNLRSSTNVTTSLYSTKVSSTMSATNASSFRPSIKPSSFGCVTSVKRSMCDGNIHPSATTNNSKLQSGNVVNEVISTYTKDPLAKLPSYTSSSFLTENAAYTRPVVVMSYNKKTNLVSFSTMKAAVDKIPTNSLESVSLKPMRKTATITSSRIVPISSEQSVSSTSLKSTTNASTVTPKAYVKLAVKSVSKSTQAAFLGNLLTLQKQVNKSVNKLASYHLSTNEPKSDGRPRSITLTPVPGKPTEVISSNTSVSSHVAADVLMSDEKYKTAPTATLTGEPDGSVSSNMLRTLTEHTERLSSIAKSASSYSVSDMAETLNTETVVGNTKHWESMNQIYSGSSSEQNVTQDQNTRMLYPVKSYHEPKGKLVSISIKVKPSSSNSVPETVDVVPPKVDETCIQSYSPWKLLRSGCVPPQSNRRNVDTSMVPATNLYNDNDSSFIPTTTAVSLNSSLQSTGTGIQRERIYMENKMSSQMPLIMPSTEGNNVSCPNSGRNICNVQNSKSFTLSKATVSSNITTEDSSHISEKHGTSPEIRNSPLTLKIDSVYSLANLEQTSNVEDVIAKKCGTLDSVDTGESDISESVKETAGNGICSEFSSGKVVKDAFNPCYAVLEKLSSGQKARLKCPVMESSLTTIRKLKQKKFMVPERKCSLYCRERTLNILCRLGILKCRNEKLTKESKSEKSDMLTEKGLDNKHIERKSFSGTSISNTSTNVFQREPLSAGGHESKTSKTVQLQLVLMNNTLCLVPVSKSFGTSHTQILHSKLVKRTSPREPLVLKHSGDVTPEQPQNDVNVSSIPSMITPTTFQDTKPFISSSSCLIDSVTTVSEPLSPNLAPSVNCDNSQFSAEKSDIRNKKLSTMSYTSCSSNVNGQKYDAKVSGLQTGYCCRSIAPKPATKSGSIDLAHPELKKHDSTTTTTGDSDRKGLTRRQNSLNKTGDDAGKQFYIETNSTLMDGNSVGEADSSKTMGTRLTDGKPMKTYNSETHITLMTTDGDRNKSNHRENLIEPWKLPWNYEIKTEPVTEGYGVEDDIKKFNVVQHAVGDNLFTPMVPSQKTASKHPTTSLSRAQGHASTFHLNRESCYQTDTATSEDLNSSKKNHVSFKLLKMNEADGLVSSQSRIQQLKAKLREQERMLDELKRKNFVST